MQITLSPTMPAWTPAPPRRRAAAAVLLLHVVGLALLLQAGHQVVKRISPRPVEIAVLQEAPPAPPQPAPLPTPRVQLPQPQALVLPIPEFMPLAAPREVHAVAAPPPPAPQLDTPPLQRSAAATPAPAPTPKAVAASSLRWRVEPAVEVPRLSRRAGEHGRVQLAVVFDAEGRPASVQMLRGSGFARLDAQALEAIRVARITPYLEDGRALAVSSVVNLEYELE